MPRTKRARAEGEKGSEAACRVGRCASAVSNLSTSSLVASEYAASSCFCSSKTICACWCSATAHANVTYSRPHRGSRCTLPSVRTVLQSDLQHFVGANDPAHDGVRCLKSAPNRKLL